MKAFLSKIGYVIKKIYGWSVTVCLFSGGITFLGYMVALFIGGSVAEQICIFIYKSIIPVIIYVSSITVLFGLLAMYLCGEVALTAHNRKKNKK